MGSVNIFLFCIVFLSLCIFGVRQQTTIPTNTTWGLLAWGFDGGGKDDALNVRLVDLDIDTQKGEVASNISTLIFYILFA